MKKEIENKNDKGQYHGYQEWYLSNRIYIRSTFKNGLEIGYGEWHYDKETIFYIK